MDAGTAERPIIDLRAQDATIGDVLGADGLAELENRILPGWIATCRWYAAKSTGTPRVTVAEPVPVGPPEDPALLATLRVAPPGRQAQSYLLPLKIVAPDAPAAADPWLVARLRRGRRKAGALVDALGDDGFVRALVGAIRDAGPGGERDAAGLLVHRTAALSPLEPILDRTPAVERAGVEQSNSSLRIGGAMMLKVFRKLEAGIHPELEMTRFLTETVPFPNIPAFLGSVERAGAGASGAPTALCVLQALVHNEGDGWSWVQSRLRQWMREGEADRQVLDAAFAPLIGTLARRTAELHRALATPTGDPAFAPEPVGAEDLEDWTEAVRTLARSVLDALDQARPGLHPAALRQADRLLDGRSDLLARIDQLPPVAVQAMKTRLHGDFHLGQVLVAGDDVVIIDFEGEPMRPLAARRAKHSPLRDVAGMLRSFAYAAASAARELPPDLSAGERVAREAALACWERDAAAAFREGYRQAIRGCPSDPADPAHAERLLRLFLLEKALYEVGYELANRPDWIGIPLAGVLALLDEPAIGPELSTRNQAIRSHPHPPPGAPPVLPL